jgi:uncharacterized membrane protein YgcG
MMKKILLIMLVLSNSLFAALLPKPSGHVNDYAHVLTKSNGDALEDRLRDIAKEGPGIVAIVAPNLQGLSPQEFSDKAMAEWKIGNPRGGILLLIAMKERKIQVTFDRKAKDWMSDGNATDIYQNYMRPHAKNGDWYQSLVAGAEQVNYLYLGFAQPTTSNRVNDETKVATSISDSQEKSYTNIRRIGGGLLMMFLVVFLFYHHNRYPDDNDPISAIQNAITPKKKNLTPSQKKRLAEAKEKARLKRMAEIQKNKKIRIEKQKAHKIAKRLRKVVSSKLKRLPEADKKKAKKILRRWKSASKSERKWVSSKIPAMTRYIGISKSDGGFGVVDFLFWHWVLFPSTSHSDNSGYSGGYSSSSSSSSSSDDSSSSWSSSSFGSSDSSSSSGGFSGGGDSSGGGGGGF